MKLRKMSKIPPEYMEVPPVPIKLIKGGLSLIHVYENFQETADQFAVRIAKLIGDEIAKTDYPISAAVKLKVFDIAKDLSEAIINVR